jgi:hypothetical protein
MLKKNITCKNYRDNSQIVLGSHSRALELLLLQRKNRGKKKDVESEEC